MEIKNLENKKVLILGFSTTGVAAAKYFISHKANVYISENSELKEKDKLQYEELIKLGVNIEFNSHSEDYINNSEFCILSPSIPQDALILKKLKEKNIKYYSDIEFCSFLNKEKMIAITGTNGKTTTTALTSHILSKQYNAPYCGNIGISPFEYMGKNIDYFVLEASSFQLHYSDTFAPKIGIFCNLTPDHILWHKTLDNYFEAKAKMFKNMDNNSYAILNYDDKYTKKLGSEIKAKVYYFSLKKQDIKNCIYLEDDEIIFNNEKIININELNLVGNHNIQNVMCAILTSFVLKITKENLIAALKEFKAIEHRLEYVRTIDGTDYYNDSKGTNPEASIVAINSFKDKKVVLIAGGRDKKTSLKEFIKVIKEKISKVILIGEAKERFKLELSNEDYYNIVSAKTLEEAIDIASLDKPDIVLLSPACASFDMFESYEKRGETFKNYVLSKKK